jgi:hypothetical protein
MTTNVLIVNRGMHSIDVTDHAGYTRTLPPGSYLDLVTCHDSRSITVREVPPTEKGASTPT